MEKTLDVIYAVKLKFVGTGPVWMHFGGGRASQVDYAAEFVGIDAVWNWVSENIASNAFVLAMNNAAHEVGLADWLEYLNSVRMSSGTNAGDLLSAIGLFGQATIDASTDQTELYIEIVPVSICTFRHFDNPIRAKFWLQDTRQEDSIILVGEGVTSIYSACENAFGVPFTGAVFAGLETVLKTNELDDLRLEYGRWVITFEVGSLGTDFSEIPALYVNPRMESYRLQVNDETAPGDVTIRRFTVLNTTMDLVELKLDDVGILPTAFYWAMVEFHRDNNPYMELMTPIVAFDDGEFSIEVLDVQIE